MGKLTRENNLRFLPPATKYLKKLKDKKLKGLYHEAIDAILENPFIAEEKTGDLKSNRRILVFFKHELAGLGLALVSSACYFGILLSIYSRGISPFFCVLLIGRSKRIQALNGSGQSHRIKHHYAGALIPGFCAMRFSVTIHGRGRAPAPVTSMISLRLRSRSSPAPPVLVLLFSG